MQLRLTGSFTLKSKRSRSAGLIGGHGVVLFRPGERPSTSRRGSFPGLEQQRPMSECGQEVFVREVGPGGHGAPAPGTDRQGQEAVYRALGGGRRAHGGD